MATLSYIVDLKKYPGAPKWVADAVAHMAMGNLGPHWLKCVARWLNLEVMMEFGKSENKVHPTRVFWWAHTYSHISTYQLSNDWIR
jgi:hypothetical protein